MKWKHTFSILCAAVLLGAGCAATVLPRPLTIADECERVKEICCDKNKCGDVLPDLAWTAQDECHAFRRTCRVQANGHCGWNADELAQEAQCIKDKEKPAD